MSKAIKFIWDKISFPEAALLAKRVPKKQFLESGLLAASDKKLLKENAKTVYWQYTLKPSTCSVLPFKDHEREYLEVAVLQIELVSQKGYKRIAEIIHRIIPYPLMLGLYTESSELSLSIAPKRFSQAEQGAFVVERFFTTDWLDIDHMKDHDSAFFESLAWNNLPLSHYGSLYKAWVDRFAGYECSVLSGSFTIGKDDSRMDRLNRCREIESKILVLRSELKKEAFNRQVGLNIEIKKFEQELSHLVENL